MTREEIKNRVIEIAGYGSFDEDDFDEYCENTHRENLDDCITCYEQGFIDSSKNEPVAHWYKCSDKMPDDPNSIKNNCLIKTVSGRVLIAYWSMELEIWRRIAVPYIWKPDNIIDEIIPKSDVTEWLSLKELGL